MGELRRLTRREALTLLELIEQARCCDHIPVSTGCFMRSAGLSTVNYDVLQLGL
jgi:hypothetical protein